MSYEFYKVLHLLGILALVCALGALVILAQVGDREGEHKATWRSLMITHGVALAVIFVAGFGLMARKGIGIGATGDSSWPAWIFGKMGIWLLFGASAGLLKRKPTAAGRFLWLAPLLGGVAAYLAVVHPGG